MVTYLIQSLRSGFTDSDKEQNQFKMDRKSGRPRTFQGPEHAARLGKTVLDDRRVRLENISELVRHLPSHNA